MFKRKGDIIYCIMINNQIFSNKNSIKKRFIHKLCYLKKKLPLKTYCGSVLYNKIQMCFQSNYLLLFY
jgi:hypothetical protein